MLHRDIHVEVLDSHVHVADFLFLHLTLGVQLGAHFLQESNVISIFADTRCVSMKWKISKKSVKNGTYLSTWASFLSTYALRSASPLAFLPRLSMIQVRTPLSPSVEYYIVNTVSRSNGHSSLIYEAMLQSLLFQIIVLWNVQFPKIHQPLKSNF